MDFNPREGVFNKVLGGLTVALILNVLVRFVSGVFFELSIESTGYLPIVLATVFAGIGAGVVYKGLERFEADYLFLPVSAGVLILSFVPFVGPSGKLSGASFEELLMLGLLHVTTALALVVFLSLNSPFYEFVEERF